MKTVRDIRQAIADMDGNCMVIITDSNGLHKFAKVVYGAHDGRLGRVLCLEIGRWIGPFKTMEEDEDGETI